MIVSYLGIIGVWKSCFRVPAELVVVFPAKFSCCAYIFLHGSSKPWFSYLQTSTLSRLDMTRDSGFRLESFRA